MADSKFYLMVNDSYFEFNPESTRCSPVSKDEFSHLYNSEIDRLTIIPQVVKPTKCPGCQTPDSERSKEGIPTSFADEKSYLEFIYNEKDLKKLIAAKAIWDKKILA